MITETSNTLYPYDLRQPPEKWDSSFLSCEHNTIEQGHKNKAGLFFFTDSINLAKHMGKYAACKYCLTKYFLTTAQTQTIKLIDFRNRHNIYQMLCLLKELEIDVLTENFRTYENENYFGQLKSIFKTAESETDIIRKYNIIKQLTIHSKSRHDDIGLFGQRLTDFDNGIFFRKIVKEKHSDIDGYIWHEAKNKCGSTYCLFDSQKIEKRSTEVI